MNRQTHLAMWDQMRMRHGITLRLLEQIPAGKLTSHPIAGMRTPVELVVHMYISLRQLAESVRTGTLAEFDDGAKAAAGIQTAKQLLAYVNEAWAAADREARAVTDVQLGAPVKAPWGVFPGAAMYGVTHDEYLHHRGQLYAFVRTYGIEPVMVWDFDNNAPEFKPESAISA